MAMLFGNAALCRVDVNPMTVEKDALHWTHGQHVHISPTTVVM